MAALLIGLLATRSYAAAPSALPAGLYYTAGSQILDQTGKAVRLSCMYWQGMNLLDGTLRDVAAPWAGVQANMNAMAGAGFDCVRIDWNNRSLHAGNINGFLLQMDQVVATAKVANLKVIFVDHDNEGISDLLTGHDCVSQQRNGIWYDLGGASDGTDGCNHPGHTTQASFQDDWSFVAARYASNDTVIGYDLWNEPLAYGKSTWGDGTARDIHIMFQDVGSAILAHNPGKLIFAECPQDYGPTVLYDGQTRSSAPWGDCTGARFQPVVFNVGGAQVKGQIVYDVHCYPNSISGIFYLFGSSSSAGMVAAMNATFGFLITEHIAPVWDGEGGTGFYAGADDHAWISGLIKYLNGGMGAMGGPTFAGNQQGIGFSWMDWGTSYGPVSDNLGILEPDGSLDPNQLKAIAPLLFYPDVGWRGCTPSPDGTYMLKGEGTIIDAACSRWTIATNGYVLKNGVTVAKSYGAIELGYNNGDVAFENSTKTWYVLP